VTGSDFDRALCLALCRNRQRTDIHDYCGGGKRCTGNCNEGVQKKRAVVLGALHSWNIGRVMCGGMTAPMDVNRATGMVLGYVLVRMRVYKRSAQGSSLNCHRKRYGEYFTHDTFIVRDAAHGVKEAACGTIACVSG
jgi:hypothetical protein